MEFIRALPESYRQLLTRYAEESGSTVETAFANLMDFIQLKNESIRSLSVAVEEPERYLTEPEDLSEREILQLYMDIFGEETVGASVYGCYAPEKEGFLLLDISYDEELPLWDILEMFHCRLPTMEPGEDGRLSLLYIRDCGEETLGKIRRLTDWFRDPEREDDGFSKAGYYESVYEEGEELL